MASPNLGSILGANESAKNVRIEFTAKDGRHFKNDYPAGHHEWMKDIFLSEGLPGWKYKIKTYLYDVDSNELIADFDMEYHATDGFITGFYMFHTVGGDFRFTQLHLEDLCKIIQCLEKGLMTKGG